MVCKICDYNFRPEFESEMKLNSIPYESKVDCLKNENMTNCQEYNAFERKCVKCKPGFSLKIHIIETIIENISPTPTAKVIDDKMVRFLETLDSTDQVVSTPEIIDDSNKIIKFQESYSCEADPDIPFCIEHSDDKQSCILCDSGRIYNNKENECQELILVEKGCMKYGPYNSCLLYTSPSPRD